MLTRLYRTSLFQITKCVLNATYRVFFQKSNNVGNLNRQGQTVHKLQMYIYVDHVRNQEVSQSFVFPFSLAVDHFKKVRKNLA